MRKQAADVVELLTDPARCQVMLVTLPEETPVNELVDTAFAIEDRAGVALGPVVVNGCVAAARPRRRRAAGDDDGARPTRSQRGSRSTTARSATLADGGRVPRRARRRQAEQGARLAERLPLPQIRLPFLFTADVGPAEIEHARRRVRPRASPASTTWRAR